MLKKPRSIQRRKSKAPKLNQRIRRDIESKILSGKWPPGFRIPKEYEFMEQYDCSRMTVNKVLSAIAATGLIERRRRAGSFVASPFVQSAVLEIRDVKAEILSRGERYSYEMLSRTIVKASAADRVKLNAPAGQRILSIQSRHFANDRPFAIEDRIINLATVPEAANEQFSEASPGTWLLEKIPWTQAEHHISAMNADSTTALLLGIPTNTACIVIERKTWRSRKTVTFVRLTFPGAHYHLFAHFTPAQRSR